MKEVPLFSKEFDEKIEALKSGEAKAGEMEHAIRHEIHVRLEENPAFYQSLRERLEEIIERCRQERVDAAEQLKLFQQLRQDIEGEQRPAQDIGLNARGFAIYSLLEAGRPGRVAEEAEPYNGANRDLRRSSTRRSSRSPIWWTGGRRTTSNGRCAGRSNGSFEQAAWHPASSLIRTGLTPGGRSVGRVVPEELIPNAGKRSRSG